MQKPIVVTEVQELLENSNTIDSYLFGDDSVNKEYALKTIAKGNSYVVVKTAGKLRFYPSRFIGYKKITKDIHEAARRLDMLNGRKTNAAIDEILGERSSEHESPELNDAFQDFCDELGIYPDDKEHKFWSHVLEK